MAKAITLIASAFCFLALAAHAHDDMFVVTGNVFCDTCRVLFPTHLSENINKADVELQCRNRENGSVTATVKGKTDNGGNYNLYVTNDHENDICEVRLVSSPVSDCNEIVPEISTARISLARNSGITCLSRFANPIGFRRKEAISGCVKVLEDLGYVPDVLATDSGELIINS